jgi:hypothetical protein
MRAKQRYLFLFSDIILLTQPRRGSAMPLLKKAAPKYDPPFLYYLSLCWPRVCSPVVSCVVTTRYQFMASVELERCKVFGPAEVSVPGT